MSFFSGTGPSRDYMRPDSPGRDSSSQLIRGLAGSSIQDDPKPLPAGRCLHLLFPVTRRSFYHGRSAFGRRDGSGLSPNQGSPRGHLPRTLCDWVCGDCSRRPCVCTINSMALPSRQITRTATSNVIGIQNPTFGNLPNVSDIGSRTKSPRRRAAEERDEFSSSDAACHPTLRLGVIHAMEA